MNILFITDPTPLGGATNALIMLTKQLKAKGCSITVCVSGTPELKARLESNGIKTIDTGHIPAMVNRSRNSLKSLLKKLIFSARRNIYNLPSAVKKAELAVDISSADIIYTNSARSDLGCLLAKKYGIPHIVHIREFGVEDFGCMFLRHDYYSFLNRYSSKFVAVSDAVKKCWSENGIKRHKIVRIYDGIDTGAILPRTSKNKEVLTLRAVIVGGILPAKGQHICIKALRALPKDIRKNVTLDIIGWEDPTYREYLDRLISRYELKDQVRFLGVKDNIGELLRDYDIGLMASRSEGFGLVTAEYMTAGLCVIASNSGANPELVSDGVNGLLFECNDFKALARCITELYQNRDKLERLAENGQKRALKDFDIEVCANRIYKLCEEVSAKHHNR